MQDENVEKYVRLAVGEEFYNPNGGGESALRYAFCNLLASENKLDKLRNALNEHKPNRAERRRRT
jgi:hypothetical protein